MSRLIILFFSSDQVFVQGRVLSSRRNPETGENLSSIPVTPGTVFDLLTHLCANRNKSCLLFSSAEMFKKPLW